MRREDAQGADATEALAREVSRAAHRLRTSEDLGPLMDRIGDARVVMLGEATHGTSEFYTWRARITRRLVREKGFSFLAVEGDWPDCYRVNRFVKGYPGTGGSAEEVLRSFERWPTWMWANWEVAALVGWLRTYDHDRGSDRQVGFYGLDVYSLWESLGEIVRYLRATEPAALDAARRAFACFEPYGEDAQAYARASALVPTSCEEEVVALLGELRREVGAGQDDPEARFDAEQNGRAAVGAERYYRAMVRGGSESWNVRDRHMIGTLDDLLDHHGPSSKAIVWEHNTHIGDARATDMAAAGMVNTGQLARERYGDDRVVLVGFGSHRGTVIAGRSWGAPMEEMELPPARAGSWEDVFHRGGGEDLLVITADLPDAARRRRGHRAVGVVYDPRREGFGNYVSTDLPSRYDAFVHLDTSRALHPLHAEAHRAGPPDTFPWGL